MMATPEQSMRNAGIFGPKESGKTTLARKLSAEYWQRFKVKSLVLDIFREDWGKQAWVTDSEEKFWPAVWKTQGCLIIVDEAAETINRDKELIPVFTRLRHNHHRLIVIGHSGVNLLPIMREQLDTLYLFRQGRKAAAMWAEQFTQDDLLSATSLSQYQFIFVRTYSGAKVCKLSL